MGMLPDACQQALNREARVTWVAEAFLAQHGVRPWTDLPLWVPPHAKGLLAIDQRLALLHHLRPAAHPLLHLFQQMLIHPPGQAASAFVACALLLERTGFVDGRRIIADVPSQFDRRKAERELRTCWTLVGIATPVMGEVILAEEPELPVR